MRTGARWGIVTAWCAALMLVAVGCASTSSSDPSQAVVDPPAESGPEVGTDGTALPRSSESAEGRQAALGAGPSGAGSSSAGPSGAIGEVVHGQGITADEVKIGFWLLDKGNAGQVLGCEGNSNCATGDENVDLAALVKWVNANGGLGGRELVPVVYHTDALSSSWAAQAQAACTYFTEDQKVFAVVSEGEAGRPFMAPCVADRGIPVIDPAHWPWDRTARKPLAPFFYQPQRADPERWMAAYVEELWRQGFFAEDSTIGLFRFDAPPFTRVTENVLKPRLAKHGLSLAEEAVLTTPPSVGAYSDMNAQIGNAIVRFRNAGVDRVLFFETMSEITLFYFPQAQAQGYYPRYGVSSMQYLDSARQNATPRQLAGAVGIGWGPFYDVAPSNDAGNSTGAKRCAKALQDGGAEPGAGRNPQCDTIFFLKAVLDRAVRLELDLTPSGFRQAVHAVGNSFEPASTFGASFSAGRHQGVSHYRRIAYEAGCECFAYRGKTRPLP